MKKNILILSTALFFSASVLMVGCQKDDTTAPVVTLNGSESVTISLQGSYSEVGATANDDEDGVITVTTTGTVDVNKTGTYTVTYSATDAAGNEGTATRTVTVVNDAAKYEGAYTCTNPDFGTSSPWTQNITASTTINNRVFFSKFAARTGNTTISAKVDGDVQVITTTSGPLGTNGCQFTYAGGSAGTAPVKNSAGKWTFNLSYSEQRSISGVTGLCSFIAPTVTLDAFTQN
jgi:hypothetical protein